MTKILIVCILGFAQAAQAPSLKFNYEREELDGRNNNAAAYSPGWISNSYIGSLAIPLQSFLLTLSGGYRSLSINRIYSKQEQTGAILCFIQGGCWQQIREKPVNVNDVYSGTIYKLELKYEF